MRQSREGGRRERAPARRMAAPHDDHERILEQRCRGETLARTIHAADRQIEIAVVQKVDNVQGST